MRYFDEYGNSLKKNKKESAITGHRDYSVEDNFFGGCEFQGVRPTQEDRMIAYSFEPLEADIFQKLTTHQRTDLLQETFALLHEALNQLSESEEQGSTAAVAVVNPNDNNYLTTAALGDSSIFEVVFTQDQEQPSVKRLNSLHDPKEPTELKRIMDNQGLIVRGRVGGTLAVSRAFGDNAYVAYGISHDPEIQTFPSHNLENQRVFLIVACDGLTEPKNFKEREIGNILARYKNECSERQMAEKLAKEALQRESYDNISVQVCEIKKNSSPFLLAVFDGHGGAEVAEFLRCNFISAFRHCLIKLDPTLLNNNAEHTSQAQILPQDEKKSKPCLIQYDLQRDLYYSEFREEEEIHRGKLEFRRFTI